MLFVSFAWCGCCDDGARLTEQEANDSEIELLQQPWMQFCGLKDWITSTMRPTFSQSKLSQAVALHGAHLAGHDAQSKCTAVGSGTWGSEFMTVKTAGTPSSVGSGTIYCEFSLASIRPVKCQWANC